jgi:hypothetical protein
MASPSRLAQALRTMPRSYVNLQLPCGIRLGPGQYTFKPREPLGKALHSWTLLFQIHSHLRMRLRLVQSFGPLCGGPSDDLSLQARSAAGGRKSRRGSSQAMLHP